MTHERLGAVLRFCSGGLSEWKSSLHSQKVTLEQEVPTTWSTLVGLAKGVYYVGNGKLRYFAMLQP